MTSRSACPPPHEASVLLGGLSPSEFMRRHWQRRPLVVRGAIPAFEPPLARAELFALAARDEVESRLIRYDPQAGWSLTHGPFKRSALPPLKQSAWTLLVQGVDLHDDGAHELLRRFRFMPDTRIDDLMISWASDGGGVGPHVDSYDVFLLQAAGTRRWRVAKQKDSTLLPHAPLKILRRFVPTAEYLLEPGDLLYLPPNWAHDGVAVGHDCMTCSIGMRAPQRGALAAEIVQRLAEASADPRLYRDAGQPATAMPAAIPPALAAFAAEAVRRLVDPRAAIARALGEVESEPKAHVWFRKSTAAWRATAVTLDRQTRMLYDAQHVFINGEAVRARGRDGALLRRLADARALDAGSVRRASRAVQALLAQWLAAGWLHTASGETLG